MQEMSSSSGRWVIDGQNIPPLLDLEGVRG
jgi:hypothetical protein